MAIKMDSYGNVYNDELFHYGKKGMKWGKHIMAQEKYWLTGNGRSLGNGENSGGFQDVNSRMRSDASGIKWKPTVSASVINPRVQGMASATSRKAAPGRSYDLSRYGEIKGGEARQNMSNYKHWASNRAIPDGQKSAYKFDDLTGKRSIKANSAIKGVNTGAKGVPYGTGGLSVNPNVKTSRVKQVAASNTFRSSIQKKASNVLKTGISAVGQKPNIIKKAKKKAAVGILKLASKLMKWF